MGDDALELRSGSVVAVDTETLRAAAARLELLSDDTEAVRASLSEALSALYATRSVSASAGSLQHLMHRASDLVTRAGDLARGLRTMATTYEFVELEARKAAALAAGDTAAALGYTLRSRELAASSPDAARLAELVVQARPDPHADILTQLFFGTLPFGAVGAGVFGLGGVLLAAAKGFGLGAVPADSRHLRLAPEPRVTLRETSAGTAPATLRDVAARVPTGEPGGIRVERYAMPGGGRRFALYLTGTRSIGGPDVFDMGSNMNLYLRRDAESLAAARIALQRAGAQPGDAVLVSGHSQGAMAASRLALEGEYEITAMVGFGNPIQADLGPDTLQVDVRHTDDPVSALAAGGHDASIGAPGSFVAERSADPLPTLGDLRVQVHQMDAYMASAEMLDASTDPRMDAVRERLAELGTAASVEVFVYDAESTVSASSEDGG